MPPATPSRAANGATPPLRLFRLPGAPNIHRRDDPIQAELPFGVSDSRPTSATPPVRFRDSVPAAAERSLVHAAVILADVLAGARPASQLTRWTAPRVREEVARRVVRESGTGQRAGRARLLSQHAQAVSPTAVEACVVARVGDRVRALALRVELRQGRWLVTRLDTDPGRPRRRDG